MAGVRIEVKVEDKEVKALLSRMQQNLSDLTPAMQVVGETIRTSVVKNFEDGGRPTSWKPLAPATLKGSKGGGILRRQGMAGGLMGSIKYRAYSDRAVVGTNKIYGAIHQLGGKAGRGRKVTIPARPFLMVQDEDWSEIRHALNAFILGGTR